METSHKRFSPVWVSTDEQVAALSASYTEASTAMKLLGRLHVPPGTAHLRGLILPWSRMPLVFIAVGDLIFHSNVLELSPRGYSLPGWRVRNVRSDIQFRLSSEEVVLVEPGDFRSPVHRFFDFPFTRLRTTHQGILSNLLLCVGGRLSMGRVRVSSMELRATLERFATNSS